MYNVTIIFRFDFVHAYKWPCFLCIDVDIDPADDPSFPTRVQADANNNNPSAALPPVPQITGCRTQGQIAVTYVRLYLPLCAYITIMLIISIL